MSDPLQTAETLCHQTLQALENLAMDQKDTQKKRLETVLAIIAESKKKIMIRSPRGQTLTKEILTSASDLHDTINDGELTPLDEKLTQLEADVNKLQIYWKSFEYATT